MTIDVPPAKSLTPPPPKKNYTSQVHRIYHRRTTGISAVLMIIWPVRSSARKIAHTSGYSSIPNDLRPPVDESEWNINFLFIQIEIWTKLAACLQVLCLYFWSCPLAVSSCCPTSTSGVFLDNLQKWRQHHSNHKRYTTKDNSNGNTNYHN